MTSPDKVSIPIRNIDSDAEESLQPPVRKESVRRVIVRRTTFASCIAMLAFCGWGAWQFFEVTTLQTDHSLTSDLQQFDAAPAFSSTAKLNRSASANEHTDLIPPPLSDVDSISSIDSSETGARSDSGSTLDVRLSGTIEDADPTENDLPLRISGGKADSSSIR